MKAVQVKGYGDVNQLELVERSIPDVNPDEVLIQVKACALNNTEIWMREGAYGEGSESGWKAQGVTFPRIPGSDIAGTVGKVGANVDASMQGMDVVLFPFISSGNQGQENQVEDVAFLGSEHDGGYAQYVVWPAKLCYKMPLNNPIQSCVFSVSGLTAWHMCTLSNIQPHDVVMVTGANGGVGVFNVQIAAHVFKAKVIAIVGDLKHADELKALGASEVFSYRSPNLKQEIQDSVGSVDIVLDVVGDALFALSLEVLKIGGKLCISGSAGGQKTHLDLRKVYLKHLSILGAVLGTHEEYQDMLKAISEQRILPIIDQTFPLEKAKEAQTYFKQSGKLGKIVLTMDEHSS